MVEARSKMGLNEVNDYTALSGWLRSYGPTLGDPSKLPWCGDFVQTAFKLTLPDEPIPTHPYLARNWLKLGDGTKARLGAVMVFWRGPERHLRARGILCRRGRQHLPRSRRLPVQPDQRDADDEGSLPRRPLADSDEAGHAFQDEAGHLFRFHSGHLFRFHSGRRSDLKPATS